MGKASEEGQAPGAVEPMMMMMMTTMMMYFKRDIKSLIVLTLQAT